MKINKDLQHYRNQYTLHMSQCRCFEPKNIIQTKQSSYYLTQKIQMKIPT